MTRLPGGTAGALEHRSPASAGRDWSAQSLADRPLYRSRMRSIQYGYLQHRQSSRVATRPCRWHVSERNSHDVPAHQQPDAFLVIVSGLHAPRGNTRTCHADLRVPRDRQCAGETSPASSLPATTRLHAREPQFETRRRRPEARTRVLGHADQAHGFRDRILSLQSQGKISAGTTTVTTLLASASDAITCVRTLSSGQRTSSADRDRTLT
jgi:hypothetical protein